MTRESADPTVVKSIAVRADDLVTALEASRRTGRPAVLRITPPFSGRMRARLHVGDAPTDERPRPVHVDPEVLVAESAPSYPRPAETEDELRADPTVTFSNDRHRERHADAVATWREAVRRHVVDTVTLETPAGPHAVDVSLLG